MTSSRRGFLGWLGASSLSVSAASSLIGEPDLVPISDAWDLSWVQRVTGRFRAVFDSPGLSGAGLWRACLWCDQHRAVYGSRREEMTPVLVVRHSAIHLIMNDAYWERFKIGKAFDLEGSGTKWRTTNPILRSPDDAPASFERYTLPLFIRDGGIVLACHLAFQDVIDRFEEERRLPREVAEEKAREHVIPGVILQPSGVFAVLRAQELRCGYIMAT